MRVALVAGNWEEVGRTIAEEWENRKRLAPGVTAPMRKRRPAPGAYGPDYHGPRPANIPMTNQDVPTGPETDGPAERDAAEQGE